MADVHIIVGIHRAGFLLHHAVTLRWRTWLLAICFLRSIREGKDPIKAGQAAVAAQEATERIARDAAALLANA